jgi:hypothetical protein
MAFRFSADWNNDGVFTDITAYVMSAIWSLGMSQPGQLVSDTMLANLQLLNTDKRFNPENENGPYYPDIKKPNRRFLIEHVTDGGGTVSMWRGWIGVPTPQLTEKYKDYAQVRGYGPKELLQDIEVVLPTDKNVRADEVIKTVLTSAQLPAQATNVWLLGIEGSSELGQTTVLRSESTFFNLQEGDVIFAEYGDFIPEDGWEIIKDVVTAESGRFYFDRDMVATFWNRTYLAENQTPGGTVSDTENKPLRNSGSYGYSEMVRNSIKVTAKPRQTGGSSETLYEQDSIIEVSVGTSEIIEVRLREDEGKFVASGDVSVVSTFSAGTAIVTYSAKGGKTEITIDNTGGTATAEIDPNNGGVLRVVGTPSAQQNQFSTLVESGQSITDYGRRQLNLSTEALQTLEEILELAEWELGRWAEPNGGISEINYVGVADGTANAFQLNTVIGTRYYINLSQLSHSGDHWVIGEQHEWSPVGEHHSKYYLEPAANNDKWVLGVSRLGVNTVLT